VTEEAKSSDGTSLIADVAKVADTSVMQALFGRTARAFGDLFGERAEELVERIRGRRSRNVLDHKHKVEQITGVWSIL
jgi:hypothetical protein